MSKLLTKLSIAAGLTVLVACGRDAKPVPTNNSLTADGTIVEVPCDNTTCEPVPLIITADPIRNGALYGTLDNMVPWTIRGFSQGGSKRNIQMKAYNPPRGGEFIGQNSLSITVQYGQGVMEPIQSTQTQPIQVVLRDVSRCQFDYRNNPQNKAKCSNLDQKGLGKYEQPASIPWVIGLGDPNSYTDPTFSQMPNQKLGANSGMTGCLNGFASGGLSGILSGNILGGILGGTVGCIGNSTQTLGQ